MGIGLAALARGFCLAAFAMTAPASAATYLYVGNAASNEIVVHALDPNTGDLTVIEKHIVPGITKAGGSIPMAVSPDKKFLFAGFRGEPQVAASFSIDAATGKLKHLGNGPLADSMAYIVTDRTGRFLLSASYPGHKITVNPIADGVVQAPRQICRRRRTRTRSCPTASNRHVLVPSLGGDTLLHFRFDAATGTLSANEPTGAKVKEKAGPRHFRFTKDERFVYLLNELDASVYVLPYDARSGTTGKELQVVSALPDGLQRQALGRRNPAHPGRRLSLRIRAHLEHACGVQGRRRDRQADPGGELPDRAAAARLRDRPIGPLSLRGRGKVGLDDELRDRRQNRQARQAQAISGRQEPELGRDRGRPLANLPVQSTSISSVTYGQFARSTVGN